VSKTVTKFLLMGLIFTFIFPCNILAQQDSDDPGGPDSVLFQKRCSYIDSSSLLGKTVFSVILQNDEEIIGLSFPFLWTGPLFADSLSFVGTRAEPMTVKDDFIDNASKTLWCGATAFFTTHTIKPGRGPAVNLFFSATDTGVTTLDTTFIIVGPHVYEFKLDPSGITFVPQFEKGVLHLESSQIAAGDVNLDDSVNLSDVIYLANYYLKGGPEPGYFPCSNTNADMNADCLINLSDVIYLANYLLKSGPPPQVEC